MFRIIYQEKEIDFEIAKAELQLWSTDAFNKEEIGLLINITTKEKKVVLYDDEENEAYENYLQPRIYTEWLDIKTDSIQNKDFRSMENLVIDFDQTGTEIKTQGIIWKEECPGALYVQSHSLFEKVRVRFHHIKNGLFNVKLEGFAQFDTSFEIETQIPLQVILKSYNHQATIETIQSYFEELFNQNDFDVEVKRQDKGIFFNAKPKHL